MARLPRLHAQRVAAEAAAYEQEAATLRAAYEAECAIVRKLNADIERYVYVLPRRIPLHGETGAAIMPTLRHLAVLAALYPSPCLTRSQSFSPYFWLGFTRPGMLQMSKQFTLRAVLSADACQ